MTSISDNAKAIRTSLPPAVRLVAVGKGHSLGEIEQAIAAGISEIGESKVAEAADKGVAKLKAAHPNLVLHMVGRLQRNKVKEAVALFDVIQSVDSVALAQKIAGEASEQKKKISIFIQFRISGKETQSGYTSETELAQAVGEIRKLEAIYPSYFKLEGLMGIASRERPREDFSRLRSLAKSFSLPLLSMGMSEDFQIAVEEGSNMVRIGRAIFEGK